MSSETRILANQANAQFSTGPRTAEGKARSAQNARKHGLSAQQLSIPTEDREEFGDLLDFYQTEINPTGPIQQTLFDELVNAAWNLRRIRVLQSGLDFLDPQLERLARHHSRIERTFYRALQQLKVLQTDQAVRATLSVRILARTPVLAAPLVIAKRSQQHEQQRNQRIAAYAQDRPKAVAASLNPAARAANLAIAA